MELLDAILTRRTIKEFKTDLVPDAVLERALAAGIWAQNHRLTQPWRFVVLGPETQRTLAEAGAAAQIQSLRADTDAATRARVRADAVEKLMSKPRIVVVSSLLSGDRAIDCFLEQAATLHRRARAQQQCPPKLNSRRQIPCLTECGAFFRSRRRG